MTGIPGGASLLFGAIAKTGRVTHLDSGQFYRISIGGARSFQFFTDRPDRLAGSWSKSKLCRNWDQLYGTVEPNAQLSYADQGQRRLISFEMYKPRISKRTGEFTFKIQPIDRSGRDFITGLPSRDIHDLSLFIDDGVWSPSWYPNGAGLQLPSADLEGAYLAGANLTGANLAYADLEDADLEDSNLQDAFLYSANLVGADLTGANLEDADLQDADLNGANLEGANLQGVLFSGANLLGANFNGANIQDTIFMGVTVVNLSGAIGTPVFSG
jgi:uncharacterized protein YjbI with pentapeptide repeats